MATLDMAGFKEIAKEIGIKVFRSGVLRERGMDSYAFKKPCDC
jgi:hypothetical protein